MQSKQDRCNEVLFFKLGGNWDSLQTSEKVKRKFVLNRDLLSKIEKKYDLYNISSYSSKELSFTKHIHYYMQEIYEEQKDIVSHEMQVPGRHGKINVKFFSLFDGESAHFTTPLAACFVSFILQQAWSNPDKPILGDHGTDTADVAFLPLLDVYTFDSGLSPIIFTGSNRTSTNYDSRENDEIFYDLLRLTDIELDSGAYWLFVRYLFSASDFIKVYPLTSRVIDDYSTFYAPHLTAQKLDDILNNKRLQLHERVINSKKSHISKNVTYDNLYKTLKKVVIIDLGDQRELSEYIVDILNPKFDAVIIAGHSLGNVPNVIKQFAVQAAKNNKLILLVSRCLIGEIKKVGDTYLLDVPELAQTSKMIISGHKLNKNVAKALAVRALQEKLNQNQTQELVDRYTISRHLSQNDVITI